ncbi:MAG: TlpA disulfide reductase family protein [Vicinamibacterales bacterium]
MRFRGKVVLVNISGSWCPNCHDEAPFLAALHRRFKDRGFEIVTLSFEAVQ